MKFTLKTSNSFYPDVKDRMRLEKLGFTFEVYKRGDASFSHIMKDEDEETAIEVEINSLAELLKFIEEHGEIVLNQERIEIYDGYRE